MKELLGASKEDLEYVVLQRALELPNCKVLLGYDGAELEKRFKKLKVSRRNLLELLHDINAETANRKLSYLENRLMASFARIDNHIEQTGFTIEDLKDNTHEECLELTIQGHKLLLSYDLVIALYHRLESKG